LLQPEETDCPVALTAEPEAVAAALVRLLPAMIRTVAAEMHKAPNTAGMTLPQFRVLGRLHEREYRAAELADSLEVGRPTLTAIVDGLERRGLVARTREVPGDRRGVLLRLTPAGRALYETLQRQAVAGMAARLAAVSPRERAALATGLAALERGLRPERRATRLVPEETI
jgi:DNA-binding MarR family transcriptional regulator